MKDDFIKSLLKLHDDRGAMAALRRGLGHPPGTIASTYPYVVRYLRKDAPPWEQNAFFLVASLFAMHPSASDKGKSIGEALGVLDAESDSMERRFVALLEADKDDMPVHLRHAVSLVRSKEIPLDWARLLEDVLNWNRESKSVQRQWAREYWSYSTKENTTTESTEQGEPS